MVSNNQKLLNNCNNGDIIKLKNNKEILLNGHNKSGNYSQSTFESLKNPKCYKNIDDGK